MAIREAMTDRIKIHSPIVTTIMKWIYCKHTVSALKKSEFYYFQMPRKIIYQIFHNSDWKYTKYRPICSSVQFSCSVVSNPLWLHGPQHARLPCPSPTPGAYPNSCPLSRWYHAAISSSVIPFSSCPQSFPASESFQMSHLFASSGQSIGVSASTSVLPMNTQDWSPWGWTGWISLQSKGLSRVFSNTTVQKHQLFGAQLSLLSNSHPCMTTGKTIALTRWTFVD